VLLSISRRYATRAQLLQCRVAWKTWELHTQVLRGEEREAQRVLSLPPVAMASPPPLPSSPASSDAEHDGGSSATPSRVAARSVVSSVVSAATLSAVTRVVVQLQQARSLEELFAAAEAGVGMVFSGW
jgi:hypothetical protein